MLPALICLWLFAASVPVVEGAQNAPSIPVAKISLPDPAYVGMPIWMHVDSPTKYTIHYPSSTTPNDFYCNEVEVKQDERLLPPLEGVPPGGRGGPACGFLGVVDTAQSKLPIHLQYPLTQPGTYLVRFTRREYRGAGKLEVAEQSDWTVLHLRTAPPGMIESWLNHQLSTLPVTAGPLLGEALPSLLASRDNRVLHLMIETTYQGCAAGVWGCPESALAGYAAESLKLFEPAEVRTQLLLAISQHGPSDALAWMLNPRDHAPIAPQIVAATLPRLHSSVPAEVEAAVHTLYLLRDSHYGLPSATVARIEHALQPAVDFVIAQRNEKAAQWMAQFLASVGPLAGRPLLWKLTEARLATEQSMICLTWLHDPSDLPRLTAIVKQKDASDPPGYDSHAGVVGNMQTNYGTLARPYLRDPIYATYSRPRSSPSSGPQQLRG
ncbi:MAG TPA: hypothetical protein VEV41_21595 [Terriglobales bacterium]|nr:hypothetical protein [Terriglobales bacterium]